MKTKKGAENDEEHSGRQDINQLGLDHSQSSTAYVNDLCQLPISLQNTTKETVENSSRRDRLVEENKMVLDLDRKNMFIEVADLPKCSSPTTARLQRIGFCENKSQETVDDVETAIKNANTKWTVNESEKNEVKFDRSDEVKMRASYFSKPKAATKVKASFTVCETDESKTVKLNDLSGKISTVNDSSQPEPSIDAYKIDKLPLSTEKTATNLMHGSVATSNTYKYEYKSENFGQCSDDMASFDELTSSQESENPAHDKGIFVLQ